MLSNKMKYLRERNNLYQKDIAAKVGVARTTYAMYEQGKREPDFETLKKIANYFDVSIDYLLDNEPPTESNSLVANIEDDLTPEQKEEVYKYIEAIKIRDRNTR
ncbi:helix-turn-helix transcriptional regulator [Listeria fleischmannii]|uniref:XRE family transcriptional regulator n=1 Tax=Listeria fleischmannii FSL S10-1203 TaxID=1265822 RepID=W7DL42_9LIST|nr:helix-turn-helix transcriptional regulator [Listeria fleischmannii]EUJ46208.1 XRE family transcriptional regulator [Listeria fleischmannii FSL S10-1203]